MIITTLPPVTQVDALRRLLRAEVGAWEEVRR